MQKHPVPEIGSPLTIEQLDMIFDAAMERQRKHDEPASISLWTVMTGIGERFRKIECDEQEFECYKQDVEPGEGAPKCPNGHGLNPGSGMTIGWVRVE